MTTMSSNYQMWMLKKYLAFALLTINLIGLWPFRFVRYNGQIKYSFFKAFYSIFVLCLVIFVYTTMGTNVMNSDQNPFFGSFTLTLVITVFTQSVLVSFVFTYLGQHWFATEMEIAYSKCKDIVDAINIFWNEDLSSYLLEIILKTIVIEIIQVIVVYNNMIKSSHVMKSKFYIAIILLIPATVVRFHMNIFYVAVLTMNVFLKKFNCCLADILTKAEYMNTNRLASTKHKYHKMDNYCHFSDEVDKLTAIYYKLAQGSKALNLIFNIPIIFWNVAILLTLAIQFLFQFVTIIELIHKQEETVFMLNIFGIVGIIISCFDLLSTSYVCQRIVNAVDQTAILLHSTKVSREVDIRFRRSIDVFSTQILLNRLQITECGLLTLDLKTTTVVISTIVSYSIVLLQFELAGRKISMNSKDGS